MATTPDCFYCAPSRFGTASFPQHTAYRIIDEGMLESVLVRGMIRVRPAAIQRYLDALERSTRETVAGFHV